MMTAHVLERLPLWVEGDLAAGEASAVQAHLPQCPACLAAAGALRESQTWLKEADAPPFTFEERQQFRREVMARIQADPPRKRRDATMILKVRPFLLAAAALGLFLVMKGLQRRASEPLVLVAEKAQPQVQPAQPEPLPSPPSARIVHPRTVHLSSSASPAETSASLETTPSRIEFQTSNPQIRIIWLARAEGASAEPLPSTDRSTDPL